MRKRLETAVVEITPEGNLVSNRRLVTRASRRTGYAFLRRWQWWVVAASLLAAALSWGSVWGLKPRKALPGLTPIPVEAHPIKPRATPGPRILYLGSHAPHNVDGLHWFLDKVWPHVREVRTDLILYVVGEAGLALNTRIPGVVLHGRVHDLSHLAATALFAINPVRAGNGMKIKMLDYFAFGLPCITTSVGAAGFPATEDCPLRTCDDPLDFAMTVLQWGAIRHCASASAATLIAIWRTFRWKLFVHAWTPYWCSRPIV